MKQVSVKDVDRRQPLACFSQKIAFTIHEKSQAKSGSHKSSFIGLWEQRPAHKISWDQNLPTFNLLSHCTYASFAVFFDDCDFSLASPAVGMAFQNLHDLFQSQKTTKPCKFLVKTQDKKRTLTFC